MQKRTGTAELDSVVDRWRNGLRFAWSDRPVEGGCGPRPDRSRPSRTHKHPQTPAATRCSRRSPSGIDDSSQLGLVRTTHRSSRQLGAVTSRTVERTAHVRGPSHLVHPWRRPDRWPVMDMLGVQTGQLGDPVASLPRQRGTP